MNGMKVDFRVQLRLYALTGLAIPALICLAYYSAESLTVALVGTLLSAAFLPPANASPLCSLDWVMLLVLAYDIPSLEMSQYPANGSSFAKTLCCAVLFYVLVRLTTQRARRRVAACLFVAAGGVALACFAFSQFAEQVHAIEAAGLSGVVAFRARLIIVPLPWVLGEWLTLVLLTLPFAMAASVFLWLDQRRNLAAGAALMPAGIMASLLLSCSRAVFWGLIVFTAVAVGTTVVYRTIRIRTALITVASVLCVIGLVLAGENAFYPGMMEAYSGRHTSQTRSTEGRVAIWKRSAEVFSLSPIWGVGSGNAPLFLTSSADHEETTGFASRTSSLPLQVLTEKGAIGAALYLAVLLLAGWEVHRKLRNPTVSLQMKGLTCCLMAGVAAVLFRELTYSSLLEHAATAMLFTMCLALLVAEEPA